MGYPVHCIPGTEGWRNLTSAWCEGATRFGEAAASIVAEIPHICFLGSRVQQLRLSPRARSARYHVVRRNSPSSTAESLPEEKQKAKKKKNMLTHTHGERGNNSVRIVGVWKLVSGARILSLHVRPLAMRA